MKLISLTKGNFAMVDDEDYDELSKHKWSAYKDGSTFYARSTDKVNGKKITILMHRVVMGLEFKDGKLIDHKDRNGLNCTKSNMRIATSSQNNCNIKSWGKSKYLGVSVFSWHKTYKYYRARIRHNNKSIFLGSFPFTVYGEIQAAKAYDEAAKKYHGEFANLNFK